MSARILKSGTISHKEVIRSGQVSELGISRSFKIVSAGGNPAACAPSVPRAKLLTVDCLSVLISQNDGRPSSSFND